MPDANFTYNRKQLDRLMKGVFEGGIDPVNLPESLYMSILAVLSDGVARGFGRGKLTDEMQDLLGHFDNNVAVFSAAKTHQQIADMTRALFDPETGLKKSFSAFKAEAGQIFDQYNTHWLRTEYRTALNNAFGARQWHEFQKDKEILPALRYDTAGDERVREEHVELDGIVRHIDDPFWRRWFPPNGWRCRCDATSHELGDHEFTSDEVINSIAPPNKLFDFNPAIDKMIFDPNHPYTSLVAERYHVARDKNFNLPVPPKPPPMVKKSRPVVKALGLENMPDKFDRITGVKMPSALFSLLKNKPTIKGGGKSYWSRRENTVYLDTRSGRHAGGSESMKRVVAHEFGHKTHDDWGVFTWRNISTPWDEFEVPYQAARKAAGVGLRGEKAIALEKRLSVFKKWGTELDDILAPIREQYGLKKGSKIDDELFGSAADTIGALTHERHGWGHGKSYYQGNGGYMSRAEFFAHCWEDQHHMRNPYLIELFPEIHEQMLKANEGVIARIKRKK